MCAEIISPSVPCGEPSPQGASTLPMQPGDGGVLLQKRCSKCGVEKPAGSFYRRGGVRGDELYSQCKTCCRAIRAARYSTAEGRASVIAAALRWSSSERGKETRKKRRQAWGPRERGLKRAANKRYNQTERGKENNKAHQRVWRASERGRECSRERARRWNMTEKAKETLRRWNMTEKAKAGRRVRRARRRAVRRKACRIGSPVTVNGMLARWALWGGKCWMCGVAATTTDHVKPLRKGGLHVHANLRPACGSCNSAKKDKWPLTPEFLESRRQYGEKKRLDFQQ